MGCFNISGFFSHLPIAEGDKIGAIVCAQYHNAENMAMESDSLGIYPLMTPVYGEYNDYGGIINIVENYSTDLFKKLVGTDFISFVEANYRNGGVTINTEDNGNQFDDIPNYQKLIKKLIPTYYRLWDNVPDNFKEFPEYVAEYKKMSAYEDKMEASMQNASFLIIYDHESIIKELIKIGSSYLNCTWLGNKYDASENYDIIAKATGYFNKSIFDSQSIEHRLHIDFNQRIKDIESACEETREKLKHDATEKYIQMLEIFKNANLAVTKLIPMHISVNSFFGSVYKNIEVDNEKVKTDILDMLYLDNGLHMMHGMYLPSSYAGQDINYADFVSMHKIMGNIIDKMNV
ncbi:MAG: hypothetical protein [Wendovervirus sonii]|uniref:Uncharacterized protein n=1 Tax=phage Lak_Megaphage_Sonny TaxID=3109229 RepID=A0ABZ0Z659_9CAUD|nr:MAG: hypothetical protein [phage Lak_Megaphage_Sonny]